MSRHPTTPSASRRAADDAGGRGCPAFASRPEGWPWSCGPPGGGQLRGGICVPFPDVCRTAAPGLRWRFRVFLPPAVQGGSVGIHLAYSAYFGPFLPHFNLHRSILSRFRQHVQTVGFLYPGKLAIGVEFAVHCSIFGVFRHLPRSSNASYVLIQRFLVDSRTAWHFPYSILAFLASAVAAA